jgi:hypothetical protein
MALASPASDDALIALLRNRSITSIADVLGVMVGMDAILPAGDGLRSFNHLYRQVTQGVGAAQGWESPAWIDRLDVIFADLYFDGVLRALAAPDGGPAAWRVLLERRRAPGISAVQFALAGMNAHIDRDLAVAVARTWVALGPADHGRGTPEFRDYQRVNAVLDAVEPAAIKELATGLVKAADGLLSPADGFVAMKVVHAARDLAWGHAVSLAALGIDTEAARLYVDGLDAVSAAASIAALAPIGVG